MTRKSSLRIYLAVVSLLFFASTSAFAAIRIMPLGDSITLGSSSGPTNPANYVSYRKALWSRLVAAGYEVDYVGSQVSGQALFPQDPQHEGHGGFTDAQVAAGVRGWLVANPADIVLLHIGTNDLDTDPSDVQDILDEIDAYETSPGGRPVWVILARIINRNCKLANPPCPESTTTTEFNNNVAAMAQSRIAGGDRIVLVDMENGAGINYRLYNQNPPGDMFDNLHPFQNASGISAGYAKMGDVWFDDGLKQILPTADAGPDQSVNEGDEVTLDGSGSTFPAGVTPNYSWTQTGGTLVTLSSLTAAQPSFTAPGVGSLGETLTFTLRVTGNGTLEDTATVAVTVNNSNSSSGGGGGGGGGCFIATSAYGRLIEDQHDVQGVFGRMCLVAKASRDLLLGVFQSILTYSPEMYLPN